MFLKYQENKPECLLIGTIGKVTYYDSVGSKGKRLARFSVASSKLNDFGEYENEYFTIVAWSNWADFVNSLQPRTKVRIDGYLEESEYQGEKREQIRVEFITALQEIEVPKEKPIAKKLNDGDFTEAEMEFSD